MHPYKAFCFDVFGTVVDWRSSVAKQVDQWMEDHNARGIDAFAFADAWRARYQPAMEACREGRRPFTRLDVLHRENLEKVLADFKVPTAGISEQALEQLNHVWHRLDPWKDASAGLYRLKQRFIIATASNGNIAIMVDLAKHGNLPWDAILGAEVTRAYKPLPEAYTRMAVNLGIELHEICMVAAHNDDLYAARASGLGTAFVARPTEFGPQQHTDLKPAQQWDFIASDFIDLARQAGC